MGIVSKKKEQGGKAKDAQEEGKFLERIRELGKISKETYKQIPNKLIQKYSETIKKHEIQRREREELLDQVKDELHAKWRKPALRKEDKVPSKKPDAKRKVIRLDNPGNDSHSELVSSEACESEFDTTVLSLTNRRPKFLQHFYKLLVFNHPFKNGFVKNNWFIGQVLRYRQEWRPAGFGLGELVKSFSLLPLEETTIELTVWEKTKSEIESITDVDKKTTEEESSKSTDSSEVTKETCKTKKWHAEASGSISFGIGSVGGGGGAEGSSEKHAKNMKSSIREGAKSASSAISQRRSVKVGFATESGKESKTVRTIKNTNRCHTVTFNFFQLLKVYDLVMTFEEAPLVLLFPSARKYLSNPTVMDMYRRMHEAFTDFSSPYAFITQYFQIDEELGRSLGYGSPDEAERKDHEGTALAFIVRPDPISPERFVQHLIEGLIYFFGFIVGDDLIPYEIQTLQSIVEDYLQNDIAMRGDDLNEPLDTVEILTPGIYVDSMLGRCSACEPYIEQSRLYDLMREREEARGLSIKNTLDEREVDRRTKLLESNKLDPFVYDKPKVNSGEVNTPDQ